MMRILLFGKRGQLGWELHRQLIHLGEVTALDQPDIDFASPESLRPLIQEIEPRKSPTWHTWLTRSRPAC